MDIFDFSDGREGYYGEYGGVFLPEILHETIEELLQCFRDVKAILGFGRNMSQCSKVIQVGPRQLLTWRIYLDILVELKYM